LSSFRAGVPEPANIGVADALEDCRTRRVIAFDFVDNVPNRGFRACTKAGWRHSPTA